MKNASILSLILLALTIFPSSANANSSIVSTESTGPISLDSVHSGSIVETCSLAIEQDLVSNLALATGKISTVCNTPSSTLIIRLDDGSALAQSNDTKLFYLFGGTGAYADVPNTSVFVATPVTTINLSNGFSTTPSTISVQTKSVASTSSLASTDTIKINATITP